MQTLVVKLAGALIAVLFFIGVLLYLWGNWQSTKVELVEARGVIETSNFTINRLRASIDFQKDSLLAKDEVFRIQQSKQSEINAQLSSILGRINTYKPKEDTDESRCLELTPPVDFINWVSGSPTRNTSEDRVRSTETGGKLSYSPSSAD